MDSFYLISELHLVDSGDEFHEGNNVKVTTTNGSIINAEIAEIGHKEITLTFNDYIDGELTIRYDDIISIEGLKE
ncbi:hypothetical protein LPY66_18345 [Dehalobacter sp. DCM]|uniref:hypothetical protein n=1 Tax=Dehalobacter sp. DCM TaxID=2907827 RepID=UPI003081A265|nr:hypothetical protein LPY66_18345 [Dehalobacter sp. DCM]